MKYFFSDQIMIKVTEVGYGGNSEELFCHRQLLQHLLGMVVADDYQWINVHNEIFHQVIMMGYVRPQLNHLLVRWNEPELIL